VHLRQCFSTCGSWYSFRVGHGVKTKLAYVRIQLPGHVITTEWKHCVQQQYSHWIVYRNQFGTLESVFVYACGPRSFYQTLAGPQVRMLRNYGAPFVKILYLTDLEQKLLSACRDVISACRDVISARDSYLCMQRCYLCQR